MPWQVSGYLPGQALPGHALLSTMDSSSRALLVMAVVRKMKVIPERCQEEEEESESPDRHQFQTGHTQSHALCLRDGALLLDIS